MADVDALHEVMSTMRAMRRLKPDPVDGSFPDGATFDTADVPRIALTDGDWI